MRTLALTQTFIESDRTLLTKMGVANDVATLSEPEWKYRLAVRITLPLEQVVADRTVDVRPY